MWKTFCHAFPVYPLTPTIVLEACAVCVNITFPILTPNFGRAPNSNQIPVIFSEDFQDGQILEGVRFVNPFAANF